MNLKLGRVFNPIQTDCFRHAFAGERRDTEGASQGFPRASTLLSVNVSAAKTYLFTAARAL
jgi:hypothetical protein